MSCSRGICGIYLLICRGVQVFILDLRVSREALVKRQFWCHSTKEDVPKGCNLFNDSTCGFRQTEKKEIKSQWHLSSFSWYLFVRYRLCLFQYYWQSLVLSFNFFWFVCWHFSHIICTWHSFTSYILKHTSSFSIICINNIIRPLPPPHPPIINPQMVVYNQSQSMLGHANLLLRFFFQWCQSSLELIAGVPSIGVLSGGAFYEAVGEEHGGPMTVSCSTGGREGERCIQIAVFRPWNRVECKVPVCRLSFSTVNRTWRCTNVLAVEWQCNICRREERGKTGWRR